MQGSCQKKNASICETFVLFDPFLSVFKNGNNQLDDLEEKYSDIVHGSVVPFVNSDGEDLVCTVQLVSPFSLCPQIMA